MAGRMPENEDPVTHSNGRRCQVTYYSRMDGPFRQSQTQSYYGIMTKKESLYGTKYNGAMRYMITLVDIQGGFHK